MRRETNKNVSEGKNGAPNPWYAPRGRKMPRRVVFRCTEPLFFSIIRRWKLTRALRPKEGISYEQELCRRRAARFAGASRARVGALRAGAARDGGVRGLRLPRALRQDRRIHRLPCGGIDSVYDRRAGRALCAHGSGGAAHRQKAEFRRAGAVLRGDRRDSAGEGFAV